MNKKEYTLAVRHKNGTVISVGAYCDTYGNKPFRLYYNGSDMCPRYAYLGYASRYIEEVARVWNEAGGVAEITRGTVNDVPTRGTDWNVKMFKYWYCGEPLPSYREVEA